jgi:hypothetical protein
MSGVFRTTAPHASQLQLLLSRGVLAGDLSAPASHASTLATQACGLAFLNLLHNFACAFRSRSAFFCKALAEFIARPSNF